MPAPAHPARTDLERALCEEMERQGVAHEHHSLKFRVRTEKGQSVPFEPDLVARRGPILFLLKGLSSDGEDATRMAAFLEQHSPEIVLVAVVPPEAVERVRPDAYDEIYATTDVPRVVRRIREQDPLGIVRPFPKPGRT